MTKASTVFIPPLSSTLNWGKMTSEERLAAWQKITTGETP